MPGNCGTGVKTILDFSRAKREQQPIVMIVAYDALMARLVAETEADAILVGDSVAMVVHGYPSTVHATVEMMSLHVAAARPPYRCDRAKGRIGRGPCAGSLSEAETGR